MRNRRCRIRPPEWWPTTGSRAAAAQPLKLELLDSSGAVRACAASDTPVRPVDTETLNVQAIWQQPAQPPSAAAGMHRYALGGAAAGRGGGGFGRGGGAPPAPDACTPPRARAAPAATPPAGGRGGRGGRGAVAAAVDAAAPQACSPASTPCASPWTARPTPSRSPSNRILAARPTASPKAAVTNPHRYAATSTTAAVEVGCGIGSPSSRMLRMCVSMAVRIRSRISASVFPVAPHPGRSGHRRRTPFQ